MTNKVNYKFIYETIKEDIIKGIYPTNTLLPTESTAAQKYNVSRPTISKVYNQLQDEGYVTKKKGAGTIVNYKLDHPTYTFGLLLPGAGESEIFPIINDQLLEQSEILGFNCLWEGATASNANIRRELIESCCDNYIQKQVDGIFFSPLERVPDADSINQHICSKITTAGIPLVLIDRDIVRFPLRSTYDIVCLDNFNAGCLTASHLIEQGCKHIYFFQRPDSASSVDMRLAGIKHTVQEHNLTFDHSHVICGNPREVQLIKQIPIIPRETGIICANDSTAAVLMSTLIEANIQISSDVVICAYDNMKYSTYLKHALTSIQQPCEELANVSIELMFRRIRHPKAIAVTANLAGKLVIRESSIFIP